MSETLDDALDDLYGDADTPKGPTSDALIQEILEVCKAEAKKWGKRSEQTDVYRGRVWMSNEIVEMIEKFKKEN